MSLLSIDITKGKRLSFKELELPAQEPRREAYTPIQVERHPTDEEIAYSNLLARSPIVEFLVEALELVSLTTGKPLVKVKLPERRVEGYNEEGKDEIIDLMKIIKPSNVIKENMEDVLIKIDKWIVKNNVEIINFKKIFLKKVFLIVNDVDLNDGEKKKKILYFLRNSLRFSKK